MTFSIVIVNNIMLKKKIQITLHVTITSLNDSHQTSMDRIRIWKQSTTHHCISKMMNEIDNLLMNLL